MNGTEVTDTDALNQVADFVHRCQTYMHPFFAPFVAVTCWGLRRLARRVAKELS